MAKLGLNKFYNFLDQISNQNISDIHIGENEPIYIRNSIGDIEPYKFELDRDEIFGFANEILPAYKIDLLLEGKEIDAAYTHHKNRYRLNIYYDLAGINISLRKISSQPPDLFTIGIPEYLNNYFLEDKGLILVTGSTGSGKSTTLASIVNFINTETKSHIITLEDPIEYIYQPSKSRITQREIGKNTPSWQNGIKYALRQDPDVIMVGEMRDLETISSVLTLVETGHLVLATLHTIDAVQTISRIIDIFPPNQQAQVSLQLSLTLKLVISQKLLPSKDNKGRVAAREILINNSAISNLIREKKIPQIYNILEMQIRSGMLTMDHSLARLVVTNRLSKEIALSKSTYPENFPTILNLYSSQL